MSVDVRRALPLTFLIFVLEALFGALAALGPAGAWASALAAAPWQASDTAILLEQLPGLIAAVVAHRRTSLAALVVLGLLGPWLQLAWLRALSETSSVGNALIDTVKLVPRAWLITLMVALVAMLAALPFGLGAYGLHRLLARGADARLHDLALAGVLSPLVPLALWAHALHDLARAAALERGALAALRVALRASTDARMLGSALCLALAGHGLVLIASSATLALRGHALDALVTTLVLEAALLGRLVLRSMWLARALAKVRGRA